MAGMVMIVIFMIMVVVVMIVVLRMFNALAFLGTFFMLFMVVMV